MKPKTLEDFLTQVEKKETGCWEWMQCRDKKGYGYKGWEGKVWKAHRLVIHLLGVHLTPEIHVLHRCDNPPCCNPDHLFLGTNKDNVIDKVNKGKQSRGESHPGAKLTDAQVEEIRGRYLAGGITQKSLAKEYRISARQISCIVSNNSRIDADFPKRNFSRKLTLNLVEEIREEYRKGLCSQSKLASKYKVTQSCIHAIVNNRTWKPKNA